MKKTILLACIALFISILATSQTNNIIVVSGSGVANSFISGKVPVKTLDTAVIKCTYDYRYITDKENGKYNNDVMCLQIGSSGSKFYSERNRIMDSLIGASTPETVRSEASKGTYSNSGVSWIIWQGYDNELKMTDVISIKHFYINEPIPEFDWTICEETREITGYTCTKAECDFRGRHWTAWFTSEIPKSIGPWKLGGLPGLILSAEDSEGDYSFNMTGIIKINEPIDLRKINYVETSRKKYLQTLLRFKTDPIGFFSDSGVNIKIMNPDGTKNTEIAEPKKLKYDFIERDYKN